MIRSFGEKASRSSRLCGDLWRRCWAVDRGGGAAAGIDWRSIFHPIKGGLVLGAVSCALLSKDVYASLGKNVMWAILTVVVVFECTVGATLMKGLNRGIGTIFAAFMGLVFDSLANRASAAAEPYIIGAAVFLVGFLTTYLRSIPWIKARYEYGMVMLSLTFSMVVVAGYRSGPSTVDLVADRMLTVAIGCFACVAVSVLIYPIWAGDDLHNLIVNNFEDLAIAIEGCTNQYFFGTEDNLAAARRTSRIFKGEAFDSDPIYKGYRAVMVSKQMEEALANFARWEPWHGRFGLRYPWDVCLQIGAILRHCSYCVCALHRCILSETQAPEEVRRGVSSACMHVSCEAARALREMADSVKRCQRTRRSREAIAEALEAALTQLHSALESCYAYLLHNNIINNNNDDDLYNKIIIDDNNYYNDNKIIINDGQNNNKTCASLVSARVGAPAGASGPRSLLPVLPIMLPPYDDDHDPYCIPPYSPPPPPPSGHDSGDVRRRRHVCSETLSLAAVVTLLAEIVHCFAPLLDAFGELEDKARFTAPLDDDDDAHRRRESSVKRPTFKRYDTSHLMMQHASSHLHPF